MIIDFGDKFNGYSISPEIRQVLLHCGYELTEKIFYQLKKKKKKELLSVQQKINFTNSKR